MTEAVAAFVGKLLDQRRDGRPALVARLLTLVQVQYMPDALSFRVLHRNSPTVPTVGKPAGAGRLPADAYPSTAYFARAKSSCKSFCVPQTQRDVCIRVQAVGPAARRPAVAGRSLADACADFARAAASVYHTLSQNLSTFRRAAGAVGGSVWLGNAAVPCRHFSLSATVAPSSAHISAQMSPMTLICQRFRCRRASVHRLVLPAACSR